MSEPTEIKSFPGQMVDWFYRTHGHLPDEECSDDNCLLRKK